MKVVIFSHTFPRFEGDSAAPFMGNLASSLYKYLENLFVLIPYDSKIKLSRGYKIETFKYALINRFQLLGYSRTLEDDKKIKWYVYLLSPLYIFFGFYSLLKLVRFNKIDIISAHWIIPNGFIAFLVTRFYKIPYFVTIPGSDVYLSGKNRLFYIMTKLAAENAKVVISDNLKYLNQLYKLGIKPKETRIINYGVDINSFKIKKKDKDLMLEHNLLDDDFIVLGVGRIVQKKGFVYLVRAVKNLKKKIKNFKLIIVGDGNQKALLEKECIKYKIDKEVIFPGMINYNVLSKYYNLADVFVMPSIKDDSGNIDASPVALMEAMLSGLMVVITKGTIEESLGKNNKFLRFVKERNSQQISRAIEELHAISKQSINKLKTKQLIRNISIEQFSSDNVAKKYIKLFYESRG